MMSGHIRQLLFLWEFLVMNVIMISPWLCLAPLSQHLKVALLINVWHPLEGGFNMYVQGQCQCKGREVRSVGNAGSNPRDCSKRFILPSLTDLFISTSLGSI